MQLHYILILAAICLIATEITFDHIYKKGYYIKCDTLKNLFFGLAAFFSRSSVLALKISTFFIFYQYALFNISLTWMTYIVGFLVYDLINYFFHRFDHESRFFWAAHVNHHSSEEFNFSVALRNPMINGFYEFVFWTPLVLLGFHPMLILLFDVVASGFSMLLHTKWVKSFGVLDYAFNSPSHHRVHHARNEEYLDKNYGQVLIIWDKLFNTYQREIVKPEFGITKPIKSNNPLKLLFHEYYAIVKDVRSTRCWRTKLFFIFGSPQLVEKYKLNVSNGKGFN